jgi:hypothetical protein
LPYEVIFPFSVPFLNDFLIVVPTVCGKFSSVIICNRTELVLVCLDRSLLWTDLVCNLFLNRSNAVVVVVVVVSTTLGDWLMLLLLFSSTLGADVSVSNTLGDGTAIAVSILFGGENIFVNCYIASLTIVPCCRNGVAGCGCCRIATKSSVALANLSVVDVVGISTFSGKNSNVLVVRIPLVSGM